MRHSVIRNLPLLALAGIGWLVWSVSRRDPRSPVALLAQPRPEGQSAPGTAGGKARAVPKSGTKSAKPPRSKPAASGFAPVRPAGTSQMKDPPRDWDEVDEQNDESFPASDPPGRY